MKARRRGAGIGERLLLRVCARVSQVMFAMRELSGPLSLLIDMMAYCSYCNEPFSFGVLQLLKVRTPQQRGVTVRQTPPARRVRGSSAAVLIGLSLCLF